MAAAADGLDELLRGSKGTRDVQVRDGMDLVRRRNVLMRIRAERIRGRTLWSNMARCRDG